MILRNEPAVPLSKLCVAHKGSHSLIQWRDKVVYAATRLMFYRPREVARFLHLTASAVTESIHRIDA
jgi:hypothetical protein